MRSELSKNNENYISKNRYNELKNHCLQYAEWKRNAAGLLLTFGNDLTVERTSITNDICDPVFEAVKRREYYLDKIERINRLCEIANPESQYYLLACVTHGYSYNALEAKYGTLPCSRPAFYKSYRYFFKLLDLEL